MTTGIRRQLRRERWPWREGNLGHLLVDGESYFPAMLEAIGGARQSLLLEFYLVSSGLVMSRFCDALITARKRGVRVCLLLDAFGSQDLNGEDRRRLLDSGVELLLFNPIELRKGLANLVRDHRKLMVVDGRLAFIGGTGLCDDFAAVHGAQTAWHELMLQVEGPVVADWQTLFQREWKESGGLPLQLPDNAVTCGGVSMKVATTRSLRRQEIKANFRRHANGAEQRVWLVTAYFIPSWSIRRALRNAARRGVDVRLLVPGAKTDHPGLHYASRRYYMPLLRAGVRIFEYQPRFMHAKVGICDQWLSLGSCNLDHWNLHWNLEANQEVLDSGLSARVCAGIEEDFSLSDEITLERWMARPWHQRLWHFCRGLAYSLVLRLI